MKFRYLGLVLALCALPVWAQHASRGKFNEGWLFALTDGDSVSAPGYDDSGWRRLNLPHDWAIEGDFSESNPSGPGGGALPGGVGWYRKHFELKPDGNEKVYIDFDGAYMNATVYINGHALGTRPYGYASFSYDLTPWLAADGKNVVAVRVDNAEQPNSRWYSGCGIYRNVWLRRLNPVHIACWGQYAAPHDVSDTSASISLTTTIQNYTQKPFDGSLRSVLLDPEGREAAVAVSDVKIGANGSADVAQEFKIANPRLWDVAAPNRYRVVSTVCDAGRELDRHYTVTGFKYMDFDPVKGFSLNGRRMKINGVCLHHDAGALGAVVNRRAIERQLQIMQEMGVNAIRCSHNPPAPELLELCDSMGLLVMDETFDMWRKKKTAHDYARYFNDWHERDLRDLVMRDRNHPSIFMWSIGNEVLEQWTQADADTLSLEQANLILNFGHGDQTKDALAAAARGEMSVNSLLTAKLAAMVRELDPRPITAGCNEPSPGNHLFLSGALDLIGFNYHHQWFKDVPRDFPVKPFLSTESVSGLMTRGYYRMPSDSAFIWPVRWDIPFEDPSWACSSYDNCHVPWGSTHEENLREVMKHDYVMGQFIWTGFDYIGEPTPFGYPARSSFFGIVDLAGIPKDIYYMYQSQWRPDKDVLHLFPHWNWEPGQTVDMWAYYNNADEVELLVNGVSQGIRRPSEDSYHAAWRVTYEPGTVEAVSRKDGREVARRTISTASAPAQIRLTPDRREILADGTDLSYITVEVLDANGNLCPNADNLISFAVGGCGFNAGVDNGSPTSLERFKADSRKAFYGKAMLIVQNDGREGEIKVKASSPNLNSSEITIQANK